MTKIIAPTFVGNDMVASNFRMAASVHNHAHIAPHISSQPYVAEHIIKKPSVKLILWAWVILTTLIVAAASYGVFLRFNRADTAISVPYSASLAALPANTADKHFSYALSAPATLTNLSNQKFTLHFGDKQVVPSSSDIKSWLSTTAYGNDTSIIEFDLNQTALRSYVSQQIADNTFGPTDQLTVTHPDGSIKQLIAGTNGQIADTGTSDYIISKLSSAILIGNGADITAPLKTVAYGVTEKPSFDKMLEVDVTTKRMYAYEKGQLVQTYLVSAGAPATPTVLGQYKIYAKYAVQDMNGYNPNGTKYFQPHVRWINYFYKDYAVHGNYWRPADWFGNINSSHGCVSVPDAIAEEIYDWAPIGTTVIVHN